MRQRTWCPAFTLVELLVVVAIISVLAAMILSGVALARRRAHHATCTSNLRQIVAAWSQYRMDHDGPAPRLYELRDPYVANSDVFLCTADPDRWGSASTVLRYNALSPEYGMDPDEWAPFPLTYHYDFRWSKAPDACESSILPFLEQNPECGLIGCPVHGDFMGRCESGPEPPTGLDRPAYWEGLMLRAMPDGSVHIARAKSRPHMTEDPHRMSLYGHKWPYVPGQPS